MSHSVPDMPRDTSTGYAAVYARHKKDCATLRKSKCPCKPSYYGKVWDRSAGKHVKTRMLTSPSAAAQARRDLADMLARGELPPSTGLRVKAAVERFLRAVEDGRALNKHGRRYKPSAVSDLRGCLEGHVVPVFERRRLTDLRRGDVQRLVDELPVGMSGSRVRSIVNAIRSLYAWAEDRELVQHNPAARVRLPAVDAVPRDRVAAPVEAFALLDALPYTRTYAKRTTPGEKLPFALAFMTGARRAEIRHARVEDLDLDAGVLYLGADANGRKSRAAQRIVPLVRPLVPMIRRSLLERGNPDGGELLCPGDRVRGRNSGMLSFEALQDRADAAWWPRDRNDRPIPGAKIGERITPHECRHSFASWLDAAGVRPRVASILMGHSVARAGEGAAAITQQRYTHALPGYLDEARELLDAFIAREIAKAAKAS